MLKNRLYTGLLCSVLLHLNLFFFLSLSSPLKHTPLVDQSIEVSLIDKSPSKSNIEQKSEKQIVDQDDQPLNNDEPEDADYLGKHNQTVQKQTKAPRHGPFSNRQHSGSMQLPRGERKQVTEQELTPPTKRQNQKDGLSLERLKPQFDWNQFGLSGERNSIGEAAQTDDHLEGVEIGVETALNTHEFLYHSYFIRIKEKVRNHWEPKIKEKVKRLRSYGREPASISSDRVTKLMIILNSQGALQTIKVMETSGEPELDNAAIEAFKAASPFPNPPLGMIDKDGLIVLRWNFILEA